MSSPRLVSALVLSPTPPPAEVRHAFLARFGPDVSFTDLPSLRRSSLRAGVAWLRRLRVGTVVVTGSPLEIDLFQDYLAALSFVVPARQRQRQPFGEAIWPLHRRHLAASVLRISAGVVAGAVGLVRAWLQALWLGQQRPRRFPLDAHERCLYLKPALTFGVSVGGSVAHVAGIANALARAGVGVHMLSTHEQPLVEASGLLMRRRSRVPLVLEFNGSEVWTQRHWASRCASNVWPGPSSASTSCTPILWSSCRRPLSTKRGASPERVLFYPNGIDPFAFDPARFTDEDRRTTRQDLGIPEAAELLTFVGTFGPWHGTDLLAEAIRRLIDQDRVWLEARGVRFLYVGDGTFAPKVRAILGPGHGAPFVTLAGFRPQTEAPRILAASDILLSPHVPNPDETPFFGSPTKLFEYMAMAKPIVASDLDQIGWVLKGWRPGEPPPRADAPHPSAAALLVEPENVEALVRGIRKAVDLSRAERDALGREARRLVLKSFTWDMNVAAVLERLRAGSAPAGTR